MNQSFEHRAEQTLLRAVRKRRKQRNRIRASLAVASCGTVTALAFWVGRSSDSIRPLEATPLATITDSPFHGKAYHEVTTSSRTYTTVRTTAESSLIVVHTGDVARPIAINERDLFALLPNASIRISNDDQQDLILPH
ncbi:hypothetical protein [Synoicihabitans lomoniglobus]|uniref:Uncharacterized protein n=1 Tax=Synoicihabitans lomoniglobus TaxID=2909285 RepID=A0AAE9ZTT9_9BACT|nr:hypothetical protein [Opitutaceae bacterium LMO-M01]WED64156.1 hypothetical protein PXH66_17600 [Opitutaceae bacterium LMO-M01]